MTDYTKATNFATKDALPSGNPAKIVKGTEIDTEFNNVAIAVATKSNSASPTFTGTLTAPALSITGNTVLGNDASDTITFTGDVASNILPSADDTYDLGATASRWKDIYIDGVAYVDAINFAGTGITATAAELNILDGVTATFTELNLLDGVTSTTAELNILDGVTATAAEINVLDGITATVAELNILDGVTATAAELNYTDGVTSNIQTQIDALQDLDADLTAIAALTPTDSNFIVGNGTTWVQESGATVRTSLGLTIGTDVQAYSSVLAGTTASFTTADETKLDGIEAGATADQTSIVGISGTTAQFNTANSDGTFAISGGAFHDGFSDFVANEHIDWTSTSSNFSTTGTLASGALTVTGGMSATDDSSWGVPQTIFIGNGAEWVFNHPYSDSARNIIVHLHTDDSAQPPRYRLCKNRGGPDSHQTVLDGDSLGEVQFFGDDGTNFVFAGMIDMSVSGTPSTGVVPTKMILQTATTAGAVVTGIEIDNAQNVSIPNGDLTVTAGSPSTITSTFAAGTTARAYATLDLESTTGTPILTMTGATSAWINATTASNTATALNIQTGGTTGLSIDLSQNVSIPNGGLTFDGSNYLDTWTNTTAYVVTMTAGSSGTITMHTGLDTLGYELHGDLCHVQGWLAVSSVSSPVGDWRVSLPFTAANLAEGLGYGTGTALAYNYASSLSGISSILSGNGATYFNIVDQSSGGVVNSEANHVGASTGAYIELWYRIA